MSIRRNPTSDSCCLRLFIVCVLAFCPPFSSLQTCFTGICPATDDFITSGDSSVLLLL